MVVSLPSLSPVMGTSQLDSSAIAFAMMDASGGIHLSAADLCTQWRNAIFRQLNSLRGMETALLLLEVALTDSGGIRGIIRARSGSFARLV